MARAGWVARAGLCDACAAAGKIVLRGTRGMLGRDVLYLCVWREGRACRARLEVLRRYGPGLATLVGDEVLPQLVVIVNIAHRALSWAPRLQRCDVALPACGRTHHPATLIKREREGGEGGRRELGGGERNKGPGPTPVPR